jgi:hypothetical protein
MGDNRGNTPVPASGQVLGFSEARDLPARVLEKHMARTTKESSSHKGEYAQNSISKSRAAMIGSNFRNAAPISFGCQEPPGVSRYLE